MKECSRGTMSVMQRAENRVVMLVISEVCVNLSDLGQADKVIQNDLK